MKEGFAACAGGLPPHAPATPGFRYPHPQQPTP